jgi:hypothetical protein
MVVGLCILGWHRWDLNREWGTRHCKGCQHHEVRYYDKKVGTYWVRVT